jgi:tetraacyldisaccharide 4'-kinase
MLARRLPDAVVVVDEDRVRGSKTAIEFGAGVIVLDDAFSHRRIARDLDVVVLHGADPFGGGRMMPRGPLREPVSSIRRADLIWLHHADRMTDSVFVHARLKRIAPNAAVVSSVFRPTHIETSDGRASLNVLSGARVVALSGVGDPAGFSATFWGLGADVIAEFAFEDHHRHTARELRVVLETAGREHAVVVTTAKDAARMGTLPPGVTVLHGRAEVVEGVDVLNALLDRLVNSREGRDEA